MEVVLSLPLERSSPRSPHHELFLKASDGQVWKIHPNEFGTKLHVFRCSIQGWGRLRKLRVITRFKDGHLFVQMEKMKP